jgi:hypothetical protein
MKSTGVPAVLGSAYLKATTPTSPHIRKKCSSIAGSANAECGRQSNAAMRKRQRSRWGKVYHLQYLPLPQGIWRRSVFFLHVVATDQAQWCIPLARMSRPVMRCAIADCGRQIMVSSATASAIAPLHMRSSLMVLKSPGVAFSSPSPVVLVTMFYFSLLTICNALPER